MADMTNVVFIDGIVDFSAIKNKAKRQGNFPGEEFKLDILNPTFSVADEAAQAIAQELSAKTYNSKKDGSLHFEAISKGDFAPSLVDGSTGEQFEAEAELAQGQAVRVAMRKLHSDKFNSDYFTIGGIMVPSKTEVAYFKGNNASSLFGF